jgi:hypothetical protein
MCLKILQEFLKSPFRKRCRLKLKNAYLDAHPVDEATSPPAPWVAGEWCEGRGGGLGMVL